MTQRVMKIEQALEIQAEVDGELDAAQSAAVARFLEADEVAQALERELRAVRCAVRAHEPIGAVPDSREFYWSQIRRRIAAEDAIAARGTKTGSPLSWIRWLAPALGVTALAIIISMQSGSSPGLADASSMTFRSDNDGLTIHWIN